MSRRFRGDEVEVEEPQGVALTFNQPLSWKAGKAINTGELLKRLTALSEELQELDQEEVDKTSFHVVAKQLAGQNLLSHKDKGVRAFTACCLVDVLKLCAPDAPFTGSQLKDIFTLFITAILPALADPSNAYNSQHRYVLVSLTEVKSIVLLTDLPNAEPLTLHLFSSFFDIISGSSKSSTGESVSKDIEYHMSQMLVIIVDESATLPPQAVDIIVAQFLRASAPGGPKEKEKDVKVDGNQSTLLMKELPPAYNMAKMICNSTPEKMARYVSQYFAEVIMDATPGTQKSNGQRRTSEAADSDEDEAPSGPTDADMREMFKAHHLLQELWRASPDVLQNVIPQLEAELSAENVQLRLLATRTLGDIISGIGAAGPPPAPVMDPAAYPPVKLDDIPQLPVSDSILTTPASPQSFSQTHASVYQSFLGRRNDKSPIIRAGWTTAAGRVLFTSAGGIGLNRDEESTLVRGLGEKLNDVDEKVRLAAVKAIGGFSFRDIMTKLAPNGSASKSGSVLCSLADRARDRKHPVRVEAMKTLGNVWGVAAGEIAAGNEAVISALGDVPTKIFDVYYANDLELNVLLDHVMFEQLIPLKYPPGKSKGKTVNGETQTQLNGGGPFNADKLRTERILLLVNSLDTKSKKAFFAMQARQPVFANVLLAFLKRCEEYNGGVMDENAKEIQIKLDAVVKWLADFLPDHLRTSHELLKYAKMHDRRSYQLLRFAAAPENDFKMVFNSIKEFWKRIEGAKEAPAGLLDTLTPIIYRSSSLVYSRSHLPYIMQYTRSDENGLGQVAHEIMHEISEKHPKIFQDNVAELCKSLAEQAPTSTKSNDTGSVESLKALALFAKNPNSSKELPRDRKFISTLMSFAQYGSPPKAAKYAVSILMAASNKKEMHAKDLMEKSTRNWEYGTDHFLTKLATISQLALVESSVADEFSDEIVNIAAQHILAKVRTPIETGDPDWKTDAEPDDEGQAKYWAVRILVNTLRGTKDKDAAKDVSAPVYKLLNRLIVHSGELSKDATTPKYQRSRLRCLAGQSILKLSTNKAFEEFTTPKDFNNLAFVVQDPLENVRRGFVEKLQKYLVKNKLPTRFYTIIFLTAFEPNSAFKASIVTWIKSRAKVFQMQKSRSMESVLPRLISVLAHHPDFSLDPGELVDHGTYIIYYIAAVMSEENMPLIYKYAERVKQARDALSTSDEETDNIYVLSDLATTLIKAWQEKKGWIMQTWAGKVGLPVGIFAGLPSHEAAQGIAEKQYLPDPEGMEKGLDKLVRDAEKQKKRNSDDREGGSHPAKKIKSESKPRVSRTPAPKKEKSAKLKKTPSKPKRATSNTFSTPATDNVDRRKSGRPTSEKKAYVDIDDSDADQEMLDGVAEWEYVDGSDAEAEAKAERPGRKGRLLHPAPDSDGESPSAVEDQLEIEVIDDDVEMSDSEPEKAAEKPESEPEEEEVGEEVETPKSNRKKAAKGNKAPHAASKTKEKENVKPAPTKAKAAPVQSKAKVPIRAASTRTTRASERSTKA